MIQLQTGSPAKRRPARGLRKIVSGGQTGVDRAALDVALAFGLEHGGWVPRGRRAEDGPIDQRYQLTETPSDHYAQRTAWNIRDSDATLILAATPRLRGGTRLTQELAQQSGKPWLCLAASAQKPDVAQAAALRGFLDAYDVQTLNVAGPRATQAPGIEAFVEAVLGTLLRMS